MSAKAVSHGCALLLLVDGYNEVEAVTILTQLRQAGVCIKSVGLTNGLAGGAHGVWLMPDLTLADLDRLNPSESVPLVILPLGGQGLGRLEADPRVHKLLHRVIAQGGRIAVDTNGRQLLRAIQIGWNGLSESRASILLREPGQSTEDFAEHLARQLEQPLRV